MSDRPSFITDLDDTLIYCGIYYEEIKQKFYDYMEKLGMRRPEAQRLFTFLELKGYKQLSYQCYEQRFPGNMIQVYKQWCSEKRVGADPKIEREIADLGCSVYLSPFEIMPHAHAMLTELTKDYDLYLYTKGTEKIQVRKIINADLDGYFKGVWISDRKTPHTLTAFMLQSELSASKSWVLGNSSSSDILPALEVGVPEHQTIHVQSYEWEEDHAQLPGRVHRVEALDEVVAITKQLVPVEF